jgi:hypothetical protein
MRIAAQLMYPPKIARDLSIFSYRNHSDAQFYTPLPGDLVDPPHEGAFILAAFINTPPCQVSFLPS